MKLSMFWKLMLFFCLSQLAGRAFDKAFDGHWWGWALWAVAMAPTVFVFFVIDRDGERLKELEAREALRQPGD